MFFFWFVSKVDGDKVKCFSISILVILPRGPVPVTFSIFIEFKDANLLAKGVINILSIDLF